MGKNNKPAEEKVAAVAEEVEVADPEAVTEPEASVEPAEEAKDDGKSSVSVRILSSNPYGPQEGTVRVFSKADHGKDFKKAAKAYADRFNGEVI